MLETRLRRSPLALALVLALACANAGAQEGVENDPRHDEETRLGEIVVTASPLRGTAEEISDPVEVLAGERLDEDKAATLGETVSGLPGVQSSYFGPGVGRPIIRGLDGPRISVLAGGLSTQDVSTVSQDHAVTSEPFQADQIEVLKGPATLLYGTGAIGGVVNVVYVRIPERAPEDSITGRSELRYDSVADGITGMLRADGGNERFALHFDGVYRDNEDYEIRDGELPNSFVETKTGALGGSLLGDWGFLGFAVSRYLDEYGNPGEPGDPEEGEGGVFLDFEQTRFELKGGYLQPFGIFSSARFAIANSDYEHIEFEGDEVGTLFVNDSTDGRFELTHSAFGNWKGAVGAQFADREFEAIGEEAFVPKTQTDSFGLFVIEQYKRDRFQLDLGARIDDVESNPVDQPGRDFNPFSLSAGAIWRFDDVFHLSFNLDRAERAPAEEELFANGPHVATSSFEIGDANLSEETANQAELGLHYHSGVIEAKVAAYYNRFNDYIFLVDTGEVEDDLPVRQWTQADARFRGFEGELLWHISDTASGAYDLRLFGDTVRATLTGGLGNVPRIVPSRVGADLRWRTDGWRASVGAVRYGDQDDTATNETSTDGYTLVDAHVAYHVDGDGYAWELFADGTNLTDRDARVHTSFLKDRVPLPGRGISLGIRTWF